MSGTTMEAAGVKEILEALPLQAGAKMEAVPTWERRAATLDRQRRRREQVRVARARNRVRELQKTRGYQVSRKLRVRSEHTFAEAKGPHGMDRAQARGRRRVQVQADLTGTVQNLKRLASYRGRRRPAQLQAEVARRGTDSHRAPLRPRTPLVSTWRRRSATTAWLQSPRAIVGRRSGRISSTAF